MFLSLTALERARNWGESRELIFLKPLVTAIDRERLWATFLNRETREIRGKRATRIADGERRIGGNGHDGRKEFIFLHVDMLLVTARIIRTCPY